MRAALIRNLGGGLALLGPRRVTADRFVRSFDQCLQLLSVTLLSWAALDRLHADPGSTLQLDGLFGWAAYLLFGLLGGALIARAQSRDADTRALLIPALSAAPFLLVLLWLLSDLPSIRARPLLAVGLALSYLVYVGLRVLRAAYGRIRPRAALLAIAFIVVSPFVLDDFGLDMRLWLPEDGQQQAQDDDSDALEGLLYDQPAKIVSAVQRIAPRRNDKPDVFFLGFAGVGEQAIFKREALYAEQVFADRYGSGDHSIELINDVNDRDSYPLATVSALDQTLKLLAPRMDTDEDVLVLMLTSHGSEDGLAISNGSLPLRQLEPDDLREVLDDSGIKWRIVIVSACYSGVFLDSLKTDTTLIITAADAQHSSFGCDDSRDLTWFGEAFLRDSLPGSASIEDAFKKAADLVQRRETVEHQIHSNPQLYIGDLMRRKLTELQSAPAVPPARAGSGATQTASATIVPCPRANISPLLAPCRLRL